MGRDEERGVSLDREVTHKEALPSSASQVRDMNLYEGTSLEALPLDIRMRFRFKMLTLVWLNNGIIISCAALFAFIQPIDEWMGDAGSKRRSGFGWLSIFMSIGSSLLLVKAHETELFPYNFGFLLFFDISIGFFFGITDPLWGSYFNWQVLGYITSIAFLFSILSTLHVPSSLAHACGMSEKSGGYLMLFGVVRSAILAYLIVLGASIFLLVSTRFSDLASFIFLQICAGFLSWFFAYDVILIEENLTVDDYLSGVVKFWADMLTCIACCSCGVMCGIVGGCIHMTGGGG